MAFCYGGGKTGEGATIMYDARKACGRINYACVYVLLYIVHAFKVPARWRVDTFSLLLPLPSLSL